MLTLPALLVGGADKTGKLDRLKEVKNCIEAVIDDHVITLAAKKERSDIIKSLNETRSAFEKCAADYPELKKEILDLFDSYKKETSDFKAKEEYPDKALEYSRNLEAKFKQLIEAIDNDIEGLNTLVNKTAGAKNKTRVLTGEQPAQPQTRIGFFLFILGLVIVTSFIIIHFFFYKKTKRLIDAAHDMTRTRTTDIINIVNRKFSEFDDKHSSTLNEIDSKLKGLIMQIKYLDVGQETEPTNRLHPITEISPRQIPVEQEYIEESKPEEVFKPLIAFPQQNFPENWKNRIVAIFNQMSRQVEEFSLRIQKLDDIEQWFNIIGRRLSDYTHDTEKSFFKNIYPSIKTLRSKLTDIEFEEFREIFFKDFLNVLEIEEFGQVRDQFNPEKHQPYVRDRERSGGTSQFVRKVDMPGFKSKYSGEILEKALVEL